MANRRFEMFHYRQIIHRMRMGESDRAIAKTKIIGRLKCGHVRAVAEKNGWLGSVPLPDDAELAAAFAAKQIPNPTRESLSRPYEQQIQHWTEQGVCWSTIHEALVNQFGVEGSYSSVRRLAQKLKKQSPRATCILDFAPGEAPQWVLEKAPPSPMPLSEK
jgi:predicted phosphoadenosine phosphosulfate sulfurtransferase